MAFTREGFLTESEFEKFMVAFSIGVGGRTAIRLGANVLEIFKWYRYIQI